MREGVVDFGCEAILNQDIGVLDVVDVAGVADAVGAEDLETGGDLIGVRDDETAEAGEAVNVTIVEKEGSS